MQRCHLSKSSIQLRSYPQFLYFLLLCSDFVVIIVLKIFIGYFPFKILNKKRKVFFKH